jgi:acetyl esterase/lipase
VSGDSALSNPEKDPILDVTKAREWAQWYAGDTSLKDPFVSPLFGDLSDLPPILLPVGTDEILLSDAVRFATFAAMQDSDVTLMIEEDMSHVWHFFWQYIPESKIAIQNIAQFLDKQITQKEQINDWQMMRTETSSSLGEKTATVAKLSYEAFKLGRNVLRKKTSD